MPSTPYIYILQSKLTGAILWAGTRKKTLQAVISRMGDSSGRWVIRCNPDNSHTYVEIDQFMEGYK